MKPADEMRILRPPWRAAATWLLLAVLAVAALHVVLDGNGSAFAAGECQYGQYGQYGEYGEYGPYGGGCQRARTSLSTSPQPSDAQLGWVVYDAATLSGGENPTGTLDFRLFVPGDVTCSSPYYQATVLVSGNRTYYSWEAGLIPVPLDRTGTWHWRASYSGDAANEPATSGCVEEPVTVGIRTSSVSIFLPAATAPIGSSLNAYVGGGGYQPTGAISARLFGPADPACTGTPAFAQSVPFTGQSSISQLVSLGPADAVGRWRWTLDYAGDGNNTPASLACGPAFIDVLKASPSLSVGTSGGSVAVGTGVSFDVSVANGFRPGGTMTFGVFDPNDSGCTAPSETQVAQVDGPGPYSVAFTPTSVGLWKVTAAYSGDDANEAATLGCPSLLVNVTRAVPALGLVSIPTAATAGDTLRASLLVSGGYGPTGRTLFRLFGPGDAACGGVPAYVEEAPLAGGGASTSGGFTVPKGQEGAWNWTATYLGDDNNESLSTGCGQAPVNVGGKGPPPQPSTAPPFEANVHFNCLDHTIGVPYESRLVLRYGFATATEQQIKQFLTGIETRLVVDGTAIPGVQRFWAKPAPAGSGWVAWWTYDTGRAVMQGAPPFAIEFEVVATKAGGDGSGTWQPGTVLGTSSGPCRVDGFQP